MRKYWFCLLLVFCVHNGTRNQHFNHHYNLGLSCLDSTGGDLTSFQGSTFLKVLSIEGWKGSKCYLIQKQLDQLALIPQNIPSKWLLCWQCMLEDVLGYSWFYSYFTWQVWVWLLAVAEPCWWMNDRDSRAINNQAT